MRRVLARAGGCVALAAAIAGCTAPASSTVTVAGQSLTIYVGAPPNGRGGQTAQDVLAAEQLAVRQAPSKVGKYSLRLVVLRGSKVSDNARAAIGDKSAIAYLGEIDPGASAESVGITNAQDLLQVSPTDTAAALTEATAAVPDSPAVYYESFKTYGHTFARVVPSTALEAKALVAEMQARGVRRLYVVGDGSDYAKTLWQSVTGDASAASIAVQRSAAGADAVLYAGGSAAAAAQALNGAVASDPALKLFAPSAFDDQSLVAALSPAAARQLEVSAPGFLPKALPAGAATQFVAPFQTAYGHAPASQAIFGYEAMSAVLAVLQQAGAAANNRSTVVHDFLTMKNRSSVLGSYSIDGSGDTNLGAFVISRVTAGRLQPFKALQETG